MAEQTLSEMKVLDLTWHISGPYCTKIFASHDLDFICSCSDRVVLLHKGKIAADGSCREILDDNELLLKHGL